MKKGFIGAFQLGTLGGIKGALEIAEKVTNEAGCNVESIFYASAFQAGLEQFIIPRIQEDDEPCSKLIKDRTKIIPEGKDKELYATIKDSLSQFLPDDWQKNQEYTSVWHLHYFLSDLFLAMEEKSSLVTISNWPNIAELELLLPSDFLVPLNNFLESIEEIQVQAPIPRFALDKEYATRYQEILFGDLFKKYSEAQCVLDDASYSPHKSIPNIVEQGKNIFKSSPAVLKIKRSLVGIIDVTPKLVDAAFGKLPGAIAEMAGKLGTNFLEDRRRIVIYDFHDIMFELFLKNVVRMIKSAEEKNN
jgi:hypothetical protein